MVLGKWAVSRRDCPRQALSALAHSLPPSWRWILFQMPLSSSSLPYFAPPQKIPLSCFVFGGGVGLSRAFNNLERADFRVTADVWGQKQGVTQAQIRTGTELTVTWHLLLLYYLLMSLPLVIRVARNAKQREQSSDRECEGCRACVNVWYVCRTDSKAPWSWRVCSPDTSDSSTEIFQKAEVLLQMIIFKWFFW